MPGYSLFDTAIGRCGILWGERGLCGVQLPEETDAVTRERLLRRGPDAVESAPPPGMREAIAGITELLTGQKRDLSHIPLDLDGVPHFHQLVYAVARTIPPGATLTYGEIAARLEAPGSARAVGKALARNPYPIVVPCHRVLAAGGELSGFSAHGGAPLKRRLLAIEGARIAAPLSLFDS